MIKPLDFVRINSNCDMYSCDNEKYVGLVTEVDGIGGSCSVEWLGEGNKHLHNAWWEPEELQKEDSLPNLLTREMAHPFGQNREKADEFYERR